MKEFNIEISLRGDALLNCPQFNKGTAFTDAERSAFGLHGKLPFKVETLDEQAVRAYKQYQNQTGNLQKSIFLHELHTSNKVLFYRLAQDHIEEILPIIYTPQVAETIREFNCNFRCPKGVYISYPDKDRMDTILRNASLTQIQLIVVTDGERILGIGDQGVGGIHIPIAKSMLYTIFGGINPSHTLPIVLDVGTNNKQLLDDPLYLGWRHERVTGDRYFAFIDDFIKKAQKNFPKIFLHWEDFGRDTALHNLQRYQKEICSFNDDIQGTAVVTTAALLTALAKIKQKFCNQRIVILGAGSAGLGIAELIKIAMHKENIPKKELWKNIWLIDRGGLLTELSADVTGSQQPYLRSRQEIENWHVENLHNVTLQEVIANVKPTILIGCSGQGGILTEKMIRNLASDVENPIILPLSNPTENSEADPYDLLKWTNNKALIATGSPFPNISQCNNALAFPGLGLAVIATKAREVTNTMLWAATEALFDFNLSNSSMDGFTLLPPMHRARDASFHIAIAVAKQIREEGLAELPADIELEKYLHGFVWQPKYAE